mgnify:CR=1 FL=1|jgi:16S rRNA (uracil1498-N3)-methyltransferase
MTTRIYIAENLNVGQTITLDTKAFQHAINVLRMRLNDSLIVFNGQGGQFDATISGLNRKSAELSLTAFNDINIESPLAIHLGQVMSRGDKMDLTIQKAVELGVHDITPLSSDRCNVKLDDTRAAKRLAHWQQVVISACEQCGRNTLPTLHPITPLKDWQLKPAKNKLILHPSSQSTLSDLTPGSCSIVIGPEGGFSESELKDALANDFKCVQLGPRILRTETAGLAMISVLQARLGDF